MVYSHHLLPFWNYSSPTSRTKCFHNFGNPGVLGDATYRISFYPSNEGGKKNMHVSVMFCFKQVCIHRPIQVQMVGKLLVLI